MKNTKKAFTLVELIVVITILAVLATVAFISLTGYTEDAKKTTVVDEVTNLSKAINLSIVNSKATLTSVLGTAQTDLNIAGTETVNSGATISSSNYGAGEINFGVIGQNPTDFVDNNNRQYKYAFASTGSYKAYQVAGEYVDGAGTNVFITTGTYYPVDANNDATGLLSASGASDSGHKSFDNLGTASMY